MERSALESMVSPTWRSYETFDKCKLTNLYFYISVYIFIILFIIIVISIQVTFIISKYLLKYLYIHYDY